MKKLVALAVAFCLLAAALTVFPAVAEQPSLSLDKTVYTEGEDILVTATGSGKDWVGLYREGEGVNPDQGGIASILWYYVAQDGNVSGQPKNIRDAEYSNASRADLASIPAGAYCMILLENDGYTILDKVSFTVVEKHTEPSEESPLVTDKEVYEVGEPILVKALGEGSDWVGLYLEGDKPESLANGGVPSIYWYYVAQDGNVSGQEKNILAAEHSGDYRPELLSVPAGEYKVLLFADGGYTVLAEVYIQIKPSANQKPVAPSGATYTSASAGVGRADGTLKIMLTTESAKPDAFVVWWADKNGPLEGYTSVATVPCSGTVTTYEMTPNTLIPVGADRLLVYSVQNGNLSDACATAMLPQGAGNYDLGEVKYELQVMSDIHINVSDDHIHNQHFAMALADIKALSPDSLGIFINGDIADHGQAAEYAALNRLIAAAGEDLPPVYCAIGNHDFNGGGDAATQIKAFLAGTNNDSETVYFDRWISGVHFVFLGGEVAGGNATLSAQQLNWLKQTLEKDKVEGQPVFLFLHQGIMDTVAGTFEYQQWHGVNQAAQLKKILADHPEVILFSGHSHWELESAHSMKPVDDSLPAIFNTASCAYLWNDACMATNQGIVGSQGYYIYVYEDQIAVLGRSFTDGQWISSALFVMDVPGQAEDIETETETETETEVTDVTTQPETDSETLPTGNQDDTGAPATGADEPAASGTDSAETTQTGETGGCQSAVGGISAAGALLLLSGAVIRKRKRDR